MRRGVIVSFLGCVAVLLFTADAVVSGNYRDVPNQGPGSDASFNDVAVTGDIVLDGDSLKVCMGAAGSACTDAYQEFDSANWQKHCPGCTDGIVYNANLVVAPWLLDANSRVWVANLPVNSSASDGTAVGYRYLVDGGLALEIGGESDGAEGVDVRRITYGGMHGAKSQCDSVQEVLDFGAGAASATATGILPSGAYDYWVTGRVLEADTGACTSVDVGDGSDTDIYDDDLDETTVGATFGSADHTAALPRHVTSASNVVATAVGGNCADLRIRIVVGYCVSTGPIQ